MANNISIIVYPVKDLDKAKKFYSTYLGTEPYADAPYYVGYKAGDTEVGLDPHGKAVVGYIEVDDIESSLQTLKDAGAKVVMEPKDVAQGLLVAQVEVEGNVMGLRQQPVK
jgi:predicted enzyme related to lactoylglutathione lyase